MKWVTASPALRHDADQRRLEIISGFLSIPIDLEGAASSPGHRHHPGGGLRHPYYGNTLLVSQKLIESNPKAVASLVKVFNRALREMIANPAESVKYLKQREPLVDEPLEVRRTRMVMPGMLTENVKRSGLGGDRPGAAAEADRAGDRGLRAQQPADAGASLQPEVPAAAGPAHAPAGQLRFHQLLLDGAAPVRSAPRCTGSTATGA